MSLVIQLSDERSQRLAAIALQRECSSEDLVNQAVDEFLSQRSAEFRRAAEYVLEKNRELYQRLAQ